jgi:hypothetical protein
MEQRDAELFQVGSDTPSNRNWNIVTLESRRELRNSVHELIRLATSSTLTTSELRQHAQMRIAVFGKPFVIRLVRSLQVDDAQERQAIVWLLTVLNDASTHAPLRFLARNEALPRAVRLSAALALTGMGITCDEPAQHLQHRQRLAADSATNATRAASATHSGRGKEVHLYAIR